MKATTFHNTTTMIVQGYAEALSDLATENESLRKSLEESRRKVLSLESTIETMAMKMHESETTHNRASGEP